MRRAALASWLLAPVALAVLGAAGYLLLQPASVDLAAHTYRAGLFDREGFTLWDNAWYGGHHVPGYSVLFPPVAAALGPRLAGALSAVGSAGLFAALVHGHFGRAARVGAAWLGLGTLTVLLSGRLAFGFGLALGLAALLALQRGRRNLAGALAVACSLGSPVAGLFLALAGAALAARPPRRRDGATLALAALAPVLALALAFPEGGTEPFRFSAFYPVVLFAGLLLLILPAREGALRVGLLLYVLAALASFAIPTPVGGNVTRLGALVAGPLAACLLWERRRGLLALCALPLLAFQFAPAVRDVLEVRGDPSVGRAYYSPLLAFLARQAGPPARLEIPFTRSHWEAAWVAPHVALARGWERQLDVSYDGLFYRSPLLPGTYRAWLSDLAVRWIALPDVPLDSSGREEARLLRAGLPWLRPAWSGEHWRVWEVRDPGALARGPASVTRLAPEEVDLAVKHPGRVVLQVRFTPYWALGAGAGCVGRAPGGWTELTARTSGAYRLLTRFSPGRVGARGARCD